MRQNHLNLVTLKLVSRVNCHLMSCSYMLRRTPDAYLVEIGEHFGCSDVAVGKALKKLSITRKKRH